MSSYNRAGEEYQGHQIKMKVHSHGVYVQISGPCGPKTMVEGGREKLMEKAKRWIDEQITQADE